MGFHRQGVTHALLGHFHHYAAWTSNSGVHIFMSPSFTSTQHFSAGSGLVNQAGQLALTFTRAGELVFQRLIPLSPPVAASRTHSRW